MSAVRPIVLVYQDFATVSTPAALPDLNVVVAGPAYFIQDYPVDKTDILAATIGSTTTAPSGSASAGTTLASTLIPNIPAGGTVDNASVKLYADAALAEMAFGAAGTIAQDTNTFTDATADFVTSGVQAGDRIVVTDIDSGAGVVTVAKVVLAVTDATHLTVTTNFTVDGTDVSGVAYSGITLTTSSLKWRIERNVTDTAIAASSTVTAVTNHVSSSAVLKVTISGADKILTSAKIYSGYRALRADLGTDVIEIDNTTGILAAVGRIDERNPLAVGAFVASQNSNKTIYAYAVTGDNLNSASDALVAHTTARDNLSGRKDLYAIIPLTQDTSIIEMWSANCTALADPSISKFRIVVGNTSLPVTSQIAPQSGTSTGTIGTGSDGMHWNLTDNTATFLSLGVAIGDYAVISAVKYTVSAVVSENEVVLVDTSSTLANGQTPTYEISRTLSKTQQVDALSAITTSLKSSRCTMVWPDTCSLAGVNNALTAVASIQPGYYMAAAVGGMVAGLPPHQGFTYIGVAGISQIYNSNRYFTDSQIDTLSNAGWYVIVQDTPKAIPYSIHELTTDTTTLESGELMVVKNFDYVSMTYRNALLGYLGVYNVIPETLELLKASFNSVTDQLKLQRFPKIGAPLLSASVTSVAPLAGSKDRVELYGSVTLPKPLNRIGLHLTA